MFVVEYDREFTRLSKYTRDIVTIEVGTCTRFEQGLNEDIQMIENFEIYRGYNFI